MKTMKTQGLKLMWYLLSTVPHSITPISQKHNLKLSLRTLVQIMYEIVGEKLIRMGGSDSRVSLEMQHTLFNIIKIWC